jgi:hypothetical protein
MPDNCPDSLTRHPGFMRALERAESGVELALRYEGLRMMLLR